MTSFWTTIFDWFIPSIRIPDDIRDIEALRFSNRIASSNTRALGFSPTSGADANGHHHRDQKTSKSHRRDSDIDVNGRRSRLVSEDSAGRVQRLAEENERLKREVVQLKANLQAQATQRTAASVSADALASVPPSQPSSPTAAYAPSSINLQFDYSKLLQDHECYGRSMPLLSQ